MNRRAAAVAFGLLLAVGAATYIPIRTVSLPGPVQLTRVPQGSAQNPALADDGSFLIYTHFLRGYNRGPSRLVRVDLETGAGSRPGASGGGWAGWQEREIVPAGEWDHVNSPAGLAGHTIAYTSDEEGSDEVWIADVKGEGRRRLTSLGPTWAARDPALHPSGQWVVFEVAPSQRGPHRLAAVSTRGGRVVFLTSDPRFDVRLPSFSPEGSRVAFQRSLAGSDNWEIVLARLETAPEPRLVAPVVVGWGGACCTDNVWTADGRYLLSSAYRTGEPADILAVPVEPGLRGYRVTRSAGEEASPSASRDGRWIAFESRLPGGGPAQIWLLRLPR